jgi:hypothetical protein
MEGSFNIPQPAFNPLQEKELIYRSLYFNSNDRSFGSNDNPIFALDPPIQACEKIKVLAVNIPISFYAFDNYTLKLNELVGGVTTGLAAISLNGNYTNSQLTSAISSQLNIASASTGNSLTYNCSYDNILGKLSISATGGSFRVTSGSANNNLGYRSPSSSFATSQAADSVIQLTKQLVAIRSEELTQAISTNSRSYYNSDSSTPIAGIVPILNGAFQYQYYESPVSSEYLKANSSQIERIGFYVTDMDDNRVSLNGIPWSVKIGIFSDKQ